MPTALIGAFALLLMGCLAILSDPVPQAFDLAVDIVETGISFSAFALAWIARRFKSDGFIVLIGSTALGLGVIEVLPIAVTLQSHSATSNAHGVIALAADALLAFSLVAIASVNDRPKAVLAVLSAQAMALTAVLAVYIFGFAAHELAPEELDAASLVLILLYAAFIWLLDRNAERFDRTVRLWLIATTCFGIAGLLLRLWVPQTLLAEHVSELFVRICLFVSILVTAMARPQALIAAALQRERDLSVRLTQDAQVLETILGATPDLVYLQGRDGRYSYVNPAGAEAHGVAREHWKGKLWTEIGLSPELMQGVEGNVAKVLRSGESIVAEGVLRGRRYEYRLIPLPDGEGRVQRILSVARDITEQAVARGALRESVQEAEKARRASEQASEARTRFLAAASHDLRQPLQAIRLYLDLLSLRLKNGEHSDLVRRARESLDSGEVLLKSLLDLSTLLAGIVTPRIEEFPVVRLLEKLATEGEEIALRKGVELRVIASSSTIRSDPVLLQRILRNLLVNAIRYTDSGGKVLIGCRHIGTQIRIDVIDTGIGIPADQLDLIFEEFYQVGSRPNEHTGALGLGLSIVRRTALLLGHTVQVTSELGKGSRFSVTLSSADAASGPVRTSVTPLSLGKGSGATVLVIEDHVLQLAAIEEFVQAWGYQPVCAETGERAVELIQNGCRPDAIVTDYRLPGPLSGIDAVARIRTYLQTPIPAILATGDTAPERLRAANHADMVILHKPYHAETLHELLNKILVPTGPK